MKMLWELLKRLNMYLWKSLFPLLVTAILTLFLYFKGDSLAARRDRINKQRDLRIEYLISAYSKLSNATQRAPESGSKYFEDVETAMADIQLFGTDSQIEQARRTMDEFQKEGKLTLNELLKDLRDNLRRDMEFSNIERDVQWIRFEGEATPSQSAKRR